MSRQVAEQWLAAAAAAMLLASILFALGGLINTVYANSFDDISIAPTFALTPLPYLGGVLLLRRAAT